MEGLEDHLQNGLHEVTLHQEFKAVDIIQDRVVIIVSLQMRTGWHYLQENRLIWIEVATIDLLAHGTSVTRTEGIDTVEIIGDLQVVVEGAPQVVDLVLFHHHLDSNLAVIHV